MNEIRQRSLIRQLEKSSRITGLNHQPLSKRQEGLQILVSERMQCFSCFALVLLVSFSAKEKSLDF